MESHTDSLTFENLVHTNENTYFKVLLAVSIIIWLLLVVSCSGIVVVGVLGLVAFCAHGLLVARLRSESVRITPQQYPDLHATYAEVCQRLNLTVEPEFYILQAGGILNAFATRHVGRNFVVVYSSMVETLGATSPMMKFLIGHEIGHIQRKHINKRMWLVPGMIVPLIGEAYHRACEATCDRYGAYASQDLNASMLALTVLASGREAGNISTQHFADQHFTTRGFFISWHELIAGYPTLSQRVCNILGFVDPQYARRAPRNFWAYPMAFIFSVKNIIWLYIGVVAISVLISLGAQVKKVQEQILEKQQEQMQLPDATPSRPAQAPPATPQNQ